MHAIPLSVETDRVIRPEEYVLKNGDETSLCGHGVAACLKISSTEGGMDPKEIQTDGWCT